MDVFLAQILSLLLLVARNHHPFVSLTSTFSFVCTMSMVVLALNLKSTRFALRYFPTLGILTAYSL